MKPAILLIDLQNDFLGSARLEPAAGQIVAGAARLLEAGRGHLIPIIHVWTSVDPAHDRSMPHWKRLGRNACVIGTLGHAPPPVVSALDSELVIHKTFFSAFSTGELDQRLKSLAVDTLLLAGVHLHGCIRATVLDAYQRGFAVWVAEDAIGSDDPLHAAVTQRYLETRAARFAPVESCLEAVSSRGRHTIGVVEEKAMKLPVAVIDGKTVFDEGSVGLLHRSPRAHAQESWRIPVAGRERVSTATQAAKRAWLDWRMEPIENRCEVLRRWAAVLDAKHRTLAATLAAEIGKPITLAQAEIHRSVALLKAATLHAAAPLEIGCTADSVKRCRPVGVIGLITPWNNPVGIPVGKIAPALAYGNTVVWKPSPAGSSIARDLMQCLQEAGCPPGLLNLVCGGRNTGLALMTDPEIDAVSLTGSAAAGYSAQEICGRRHIPLQAELGGNNGAIVWSDCDLQSAAAEVVDAAFAFAGQRCTANRRVIVESRVHDTFIELLERAVGGLVCGDPLDAKTRMGPLISADKQREIATLLERARSAGATILMPRGTEGAGAFFPPAIVCCGDPHLEIVQEETFGPVLVVQRATDWFHAMKLCNGVRQGLVAALFSDSKENQTRFLADAQAGILKINLATADANAEAPFGGWKASGIGPPEHGPGNREFYTRTQAVYQAGG